MRGLTGVKSNYDEDVFENGHTSVWGSYWSPNIGWGYRCCFQFEKSGKCLGEQGKIETIKREYQIEVDLKEAALKEQRIQIEAMNKQFKPLQQVDSIKE